MLLVLGLSHALVPSLPPQRARVVTYSSEAEAISAESHEAAPAAPPVEAPPAAPPSVPSGGSWLPGGLDVADYLTVPHPGYACLGRGHSYLCRRSAAAAPPLRRRCALGCPSLRLRRCCTAAAPLLRIG